MANSIHFEAKNISAENAIGYAFLYEELQCVEWHQIVPMDLGEDFGGREEGGCFGESRTFSNIAQSSSWGEYALNEMDSSGEGELSSSSFAESDNDNGLEKNTTGQWNFLEFEMKCC